MFTFCLFKSKNSYYKKIELLFHEQNSKPLFDSTYAFHPLHNFKFNKIVYL